MRSRTLVVVEVKLDMSGLGDADEEIRLAVKVVPWEYHVRAFLKGLKGKSEGDSAYVLPYVPLGTLKIDKQASKTYRIKIPNKLMATRREATNDR